MEVNTKKIGNVVDFFQKYIIPFIVTVFMAGIIWSGISSELRSHADDLIELNGKVQAYQQRLDNSELKQAETEKDVAERLSAIETKIDFIIKILDKK